MASFLAFVPRLTTQLSPESLCSKLVAGGLPCRVYGAEGSWGIEFEGCSDLLYLLVKHGLIEQVELAPDYHTKPPFVSRIVDLLEEIGFEWIDEDDPRRR